jgi:hypothetical protein
MKRLWLVLVLLAGCGRTNTLTLPNGTDGGAPFDCRATCEAVKAQLIRDFGVRPAAIDCASFPAGADCMACRLEFERRFNVSTMCQ